MNYLINMEIEFKVFSRSDFMNSQKMNGQITQLQTLDQESIKKTINLYDQLFLRTPNIQSLITSKNIQMNSECLKSESIDSFTKEKKQFYQISLEGVFFREQLEVMIY